MLSIAPNNLYSVRECSEVLVVDFHPETLDATNGQHLAENLLDLLHQSNASRLYLNFCVVRTVTDHIWLDLVNLNLYLQETERHLCVVNLTPSLLQQLHSLEHPEFAATQEGAL